MSVKHLIVGVEKDSIAHKLHIKPGDKLLSLNKEPITDIFDYQFIAVDEYLSIEIEKADGKVVSFDIEKDYGDDLGMEFGSSLMDEYRSCRNRCIFCFIDQMPPGMRDTLYFKDDDSRLSFLQGNYITLTNMKEEDIDRIIRYHMEPINISVHTTDPELRCRMLNNRFAGDSLRYIKKLADAGIEMNAQIVMCSGINDGENLKKTISDLLEYAPTLSSVSVVPVGLTKYREGLADLEPVSSRKALETIKIVEDFQKKAMEKCDLHFIHASDELYLLAGLPLPEEERYDGYLQLENGVGMLRLLKEEFSWEMENTKEAVDTKERRISVATGLLAAPYITKLAESFTEKYGGRIDVHPIRNDFFGELITVSGLITGGDLKGQLSGLDLGDELLIPVNMLRSGENYFLDDVTVTELSEALNTKITVVPNTGEGLFRAFAGITNDDFERQCYEQDGCCDCWQA